MDQTILASFNVTITSAENASWQGYVEINGVRHEFHAGQHLSALQSHAAGHDEADIARAQDGSLPRVAVQYQMG